MRAAIESTLHAATRAATHRVHLPPSTFPTFHLPPVPPGAPRSVAPKPAIAPRCARSTRDIDRCGKQRFISPLFRRRAARKSPFRPPSGTPTILNSFSNDFAPPFKSARIRDAVPVRIAAGNGPDRKRPAFQFIYDYCQNNDLSLMKRKSMAQCSKNSIAIRRAA
ncbi:hypothetical protein ACV229_17930 [Burkholderia sp. MR1-5-21]